MTEHLKRFYSENERTLEDDIPELVDYIRPGYRVLDVGCGSGTVTLDVANAVKPGIIIGIDPVEYAVECAQKFATKRKIKNATFQTGDGYHLPFEDASFDVVFSNTVLHYFNDPLRALKQQLRLVKPGGWLVAAGVREWGMVRRYPRCPSWDAVFDEARSWANSCGYEQTIDSLTTDDLALKVKARSVYVFNDSETGFVGSFTMSEFSERSIAGWRKTVTLTPNIELDLLNTLHLNHLAVARRRSGEGLGICILDRRAKSPEKGQSRSCFSDVGPAMSSCGSTTPRQDLTSLR